MAEREPMVAGAGGPCRDAAQCWDAAQPGAADGHAFWYSNAKTGNP